MADTAVVTASVADTATADIVVATAAEFIPVTLAEPADSLVAELVDMRAAAEASGADLLAAASTAVVAVTAAADTADPGRTSFRKRNGCQITLAAVSFCSSLDASEISGQDVRVRSGIKSPGAPSIAAFRDGWDVTVRTTYALPSYKN